VCLGEYSPTSSTQAFCSPCREKEINNRKFKKGGPGCACGCGRAVNWNYAYKKWSRFIAGHDKTGKPSWRLGQKTPDHLLKRKDGKCKQCAAQFRSIKPQIFCCRVCQHKFMRQEEASNWRGGRLHHGYKIYIKRPEHRVILEEILKKKLKPKDVVHHIDDNKTNNDLSNLHVFDCQACHMVHHQSGRPLAYSYDETHKSSQIQHTIELALGRELCRHESIYCKTQGSDCEDINNLWLFHCPDCRKHYIRNKTTLRHRYEEVHGGTTIKSRKQDCWRLSSRRTKAK
jgi:hypothetical protein